MSSPSYGAARAPGRTSPNITDADAANQNVVATPADQLVVAVMQAHQFGFIVGAIAAYQGVILATSQQVVVRAAVEVVIAVLLPSQQGLVLVVPIKLVIAGSAKQTVVPAVELVVAMLGFAQGLATH